MIMFGSSLPSALGWLVATKVYSGTGADIVMESISQTTVRPTSSALLGFTDEVRACGNYLHSDNLVFIVRDTIRRGGGSSIELEQMDSADPPLGLHNLHSGRHHQWRYRGTGEIQQQAGPIGSGHTCL